MENRPKSTNTLPFSNCIHSLRALKTQFKKIYRRCTCDCASVGTTGCSNTLGTNDKNESLERQVCTSAAGEAVAVSKYQTPIIPGQVEEANIVFVDLIDDEETGKYPEDVSFFFRHWGKEFNFAKTCPSPALVEKVLPSRPDGDFVFQDQISTPLPTSGPQLSILQRQRNQRSHRNLFYQQHRKQPVQLSQCVSDTSMYDRSPATATTTAQSKTLVTIRSNPEDKSLLHMPFLQNSTSLKTFNASASGSSKPTPRLLKSRTRYSHGYNRSNDNNNKPKLKYLSSKNGSNRRIGSYYRRVSSSSIARSKSMYNNTVTINDHIHCEGNNCQNSLGCFNFNIPSNIIWKDLPKSIPLSINSGLVESMFIPIWCNHPMRKAPFFPKVKHVINWSAVNLRNERTKSKKKKLLEIARCDVIFKTNIWALRRQIGWMKKRLAEERRIVHAVFNGDINDRFQFIHWLNENKNNTNAVGRFFDIEEKRIVAIKIVPYKAPSCLCDQLKLKVGALHEIKALIQLEHVNIVQILTYFEHASKLHLVVEACDHSLRCELLCASKGVNPTMAHSVIHQIILGLDHCHKNFYLHRNLCPDNILVTVEGTVKIGDFSKSIYLKGPGLRFPCSPGTIAYGAPELLALDAEYDSSADIWSVGCILVELLRGKVLWGGGTSEEQLLLIHKTVGPLLTRHAEVAMIKEDDEPPVKCLHEYFDEPLNEAHLFIEKCFEVDPSKRLSCQGLLEHKYMKLGNSEQSGQNKIVDTALPRFALWEIRPPSSPFLFFSKDEASSADAEDRTLSGDVMDSYQKENTTSDIHETDEPQDLRSKTVVKKPRASVVYSSEFVTEGKDSCAPTPRRCVLSSPHLFPEDIDFMKELRGVDHRCLRHSVNDFTAPRALSSTLQECSPFLRRGYEVRKSITECRKPLENLSNHGDSNTFVCNDADSIKNGLPTGPRSRMQYIINVLPYANWNTVQLFTTYLNQSAKKNPKTFSNHLGALTSTLLEQIADAKSKVSGPAIRILNNMCESRGDLFEPESERIMESILNKLGGPSFIEKEGNEVLKHLVNALKPTKAVLALLKFGANHKTAASRQTTILLVYEALKKVDLIAAFGLPGEQNATQRRLSNAVFDISTRFLRDSNPHTRVAARDIYQLLMSHPGFWYLYQSTVPDEKRQWVNRLLEEIRRYQISDKKILKYVPTAVGTGIHKLF